MRDGALPSSILCVLEKSKRKDNGGVYNLKQVSCKTQDAHKDSFKPI